MKLLIKKFTPFKTSSRQITMIRHSKSANHIAFNCDS